MFRMKGTLEQRFWAKVDRGDPDACWEWTAAKVPRGYGRIFSSGRLIYSHRLSYELNVAPIPSGLDILHTCDHPPCCNPRHLFPGTHAQNMADKVIKGRQSHGEQVATKLTDGDVLEIRRLCEGDLSQETIGQLYGVTKQMVSLIKLRKAWGHLA